MNALSYECKLHDKNPNPISYLHKKNTTNTRKEKQSKYGFNKKN